jgi:PleD family two-component response regulator
MNSTMRKLSPITSEAHDQKVEGALDAGVKDCLTKPIKTGKTAETVNRLLK